MVGGIAGYVFMADGLDLLCFVPEALVSFRADGEVVIDQAGYVAGGWSQRNLRWSDATDGHAHVFPDARHLVRDGAAPGFQSQLAHWRAVQG